MNWETLADDAVIQTTVQALKTNGIESVVVDTGEEAKNTVLEMIPQGAEVMNMTSITLTQIGVEDAILNSGKYNAVKNTLNKMDRETQRLEMHKLGAAPEWAVGSVHAVTQEGQIYVVSNTGSQLPAYAYGAAHVIWVVGTQKIVQNMQEARKRVYEYILPLESERARKAYGLTEDWHSNVSKELIINKEVLPNRLTAIFVKQKLGF